MNELKHEDVMRALEELLKEVGKVKGAHKPYLTIKHALALLREKDARIEELKADLDYMVTLSNDNGNYMEKLLDEKDIVISDKDALIAKHEAYIDNLIIDKKYLVNDKACLVAQIADFHQMVLKKDAEIERLKRQITGEVEDDFPNCAISGCEAADAVCHLTCPYSKELADLRRDAIARLKEKCIDVYIYTMEYDTDGTPYFAFTFDKNKVIEAREAWTEGSIIESCYDEYVYGDFYEDKLNDMCRIIIKRYEREKKE